MKLAREARSFFELYTRKDGTTCWDIKRDAPEWLHELELQALYELESVDRRNPVYFFTH